LRARADNDICASGDTVATYVGLTADALPGTGPVTREFVPDALLVTALVRRENLSPFLPQGFNPIVEADGTVIL
jgi:hypothetical protein